MEWLFITIFLGAFLFSRRCFAQTETFAAYESPDFWVRKCEDRQDLLLTTQEIQTQNQKMQEKSAWLYDMTHIPLDWQEEYIRRNGPEAAIWKKIFYHNGQPVSQNWKKKLYNECNYVSLLKKSCKYAVTVRRCNVRRLPEQEGWYLSSEDTAFDVLQETVLEPSEAVIVLHYSRLGNYSYIQARTYRGWVLNADLGYTQRINWLNYIKPSMFITILSVKFSITNGRELLVYQMGARIPVRACLTSGVLLLVPAADEHGFLEEQVEYKAYETAFCLGRLPYTRENILRQAFTYLGKPYGWGGKCQTVDCSGLVMTVYQTVGLCLPRNAGEQALALPHAVEFSGRSLEQKCQLFCSLKPGDLLFMSGHVMLYLGAADKKHFVLHALSGYKKQDLHGTSHLIDVMQVVVTDVSIERKRGGTFFEAIYRGGSFV